MRRTITDEVRDRIRADLRTARAARRSGDREHSWKLLEDAHVLSQPWATWHVRVHASMLFAAVSQSDAREVVGQAVRLVAAAPASATGRYPVGNSGRARVPATKPMPVPADLADLLRRAKR